MKRAITQVHEIELTSRCNLACVYCPNPVLKRPKVDMSMQDFIRSLECVSYFVKQGTQQELSITGVGEALMHPEFATMLHMARAVIGPTRLLTFSTNGLLLDDAILSAIASAQPVVYISMHRPEVGAIALERAKKYVKVGTNVSFATSALNWSGEVDWHVSHPPMTCEYLRSGWAVIRADGIVGTCCWDAESVHGRIGTIHDDPATWRTAPHEACRGCSLRVPDEFQDGRIMETSS